MAKTGIFSGTFDPVHAGHVAFALEAAEAAGLERVYFIPEAMPRRKQSVTHYAHRVAMLKLALRPYQKLDVLELPDKQFSVTKTLPRLRKQLPDDDLFMLIGSDMLQLLSTSDAAQQWPGFELFIKQVTLLVGVRSDSEKSKAEIGLKLLQPTGHVIETNRPHVSSRDIRHVLMQGKEHDELLGSLKSYIRQHWLYASVDVNNS